YARALTEHPGAGPSRWSFWLVGSDMRDEIAGELEQRDRDWGHIIKAEKYDVRATTWGRLIDQAERRLSFYREQLSYAADHRNPALSITETPQLISGVGGVDVSLRGCQAVTS
ncbi:MAG: hypothetical protein M3063_01910, partial [Actinomycetota bacterium]|nr:hypothetical protein [Actinomycetota bacterium]